MEKLVQRLKRDLVLNESNKTSGSCLGGNAAEYYFLMTKQVTGSFDPISTSPVFSLSEDGKTLNLSCKEDVSLLDLRNSLHSFVEPLNLPAMTHAEMFSKLEELSTHSPELQSLYNCSLLFAQLLKFYEGGDKDYTHFKDDVSYREVSDEISKYSPDVRLFLIRLQVTLENLIRYQIDEDTTLFESVIE